jgi:glycosyltransferase involved in cell wall biosynthesis
MSQQEERPSGLESPHSPLATHHSPLICFLGLENLAVLVPGYERFRVGGEQVQQTLLARALVRRGWRVSMVTLDYGQPDGLEFEGIRVFRAYAPRAGLPVLRFVYPRWTQLWAALERADADVYYTSCAGMTVGLLARFCQKHGRPFVFRIASDNDCHPGKLLIPLARDRRLYEYGLRRADAILAQSEQQAAALRENYGLDSTLAGMLVERPERLLSYATRDIDVLWVNNLRSLKRPERVLELAERLPELRFHLIGGPHEPALYESLRTKAAGLPNLVFHGPLPYRETSEFYDCARVLLNTSEVEGFPNAYLQAWVRGVPVVTFLDPDGLIQRHGLGARATSLDDMAAQLQGFCADPLRWERASAACRAFMDRECGEERVLAPYLAAFEDLAVRSSSPLAFGRGLG